MHNAALVVQVLKGKSHIQAGAQHPVLRMASRLSYVKAHATTKGSMGQICSAGMLGHKRRAMC